MRDIENLEEADADLVTNVFEIMTGFMGSEYAIVDALLSRKAITWRYVHYLYLPVEVLLVSAPKKRREHDRAYEQTTWPKFSEAGSQASSIELGIRSWEFDGNFQLVHTITKISKSEFHDSEDQELTIYSLPISPLRYADEVVKRGLEGRGLAFWQLRNGRYVSYSGSSADSDDSVNGRFMVDSVAFRKWNPSLHGAALDDNLGEVQTARDEPPDGNFVLLLPPILPGYDLQRNKWLKLSVASISPIIWQKQAFQNLCIDEATKELLMALVPNDMKSKKKQNEDIIESKKQGFILLFYGGSGTGKTLAAECIAEISEKPLLRVSVADIASKPAELEKLIRTAFNIGKTWDCILLLEDADVVLEERSANNLGGNTLVAAFRLLADDLIGTLILTSNHLGTLDDAFLSRINLTVNFKPLELEQRRSIWRKLLTKAQLSGDTEDDLLGHVDKLAEINMNGRQIRNAVSGAQQLASYKERPLDYGTLEQVVGSSQQFNKLLTTRWRIR